MKISMKIVNENYTYEKRLGSPVWTEWPSRPRGAFPSWVTPGPRPLRHAWGLARAGSLAGGGTVPCAAGAWDHPRCVKRKSGAWRGCVSPEAVWLSHRLGGWLAPKPLRRAVSQAIFHPKLPPQAPPGCYAPGDHWTSWSMTAWGT